MDTNTPQDAWTRTSWVGTANDAAVGFPLQSLPFCSFVPAATPDVDPHLGVGIGSFILDLDTLSRVGLLNSLAPDIKAACAAPQLNALMRCGPAAWSALRQRLFDLLTDDASPGERDEGHPADDQRRIVASSMVPVARARFLKPVATENYTDFYSSLHHATNVGRLFRPESPLLPNYHWLPIGYHGRASSVVISGTPIRRPHGQFKFLAEDTPVFQPTSQLDYELEVAAYVGTGNPLGTRVPIAEAEQHLFGLSLLNDWSARDVQAWEYQPLGPFLGKSFGTTVSPWVIPMAALAPYRTPLTLRAADVPQPLPYLTEPASAQPSGFDITVEVLLSTSHMREDGLAPVRLSTGNLRDLHWSFAQMLTHHTSNGCNLLAGDILASGTISGKTPESLGCLLEITRRGRSPLRLATGEVREFLADGDEIILRGFCEREDLPRISFGECRGTIQPASTVS